MCAMGPSSSPRPKQATARDVWRMFDRIAPRYDLLNRLLSMRRDVAWRRRVSRSMPRGRPLHILDLATGTADVLLDAAQRRDVALGVGLDPSPGMLELARTKLERINATDGAPRLTLVRGDATALGFRDASFDVVTIAFGIRNVADPLQGLREMHRVLRPGGRALTLEFSLPGNPAFRAFYLAYFRHILPRLGGLISGDAPAYRYLNETVEGFPYGAAFCELMTRAGFTEVSATPLTGGIATLYQGDR